MVYKLLTMNQWNEARTLQEWGGAPVDHEDGFVHLSTATQVKETARRYFSDCGPVVLLGYDEEDLPDLRYEPSRGGQLFPHQYGPLPMSFKQMWRVNKAREYDRILPGVTGSLSGVKVLDLSRILAGPTCTQLLGDLGADVVKVERPGVGDDTRIWGPPFVKDRHGENTAESAYYLCANRNKRSITVDLTTPEGVALIRELAAEADVLIENFKVGGLKKYGLSYEDLKKSHPHLVYCSITGFGQTGPNSHRAGYDLLAQGYGGIMSLTGEVEGEPMKAGVGICDVMCGMYASTAILAALRHRDLSGVGQYIDVALVDVQVAWLVNAATHYLNSGQPPQRRGNQHPNIVPYQVFEGSDGHLIVAVGNDRQYKRFCSIVGRPELATDERFVTNAQRLLNREALIVELRRAIRIMPVGVLLAKMEEQGVPGGPIHSLPQVFASNQVAARQMQIEMTHASGTPVHLVANPLKLSKTPILYRRSPPTNGEHNDEVRDEWLQR